MPLILGTKIIEHDACFALFENDKPLFVYEQERFNRRKHGFTYAIDGLTDGLKKHNINVSDIAYVTNYLDENLVKKRAELYIQAYGTGAISDAYLFANQAYEKAVQYKLKLLSLGFKEEQIYSIRHHLGHCAAVFYPSPYKEAAILSVDGGGEAESCVLAFGQGKEIQILKSIPYPYSLGHLYETVTRWLGWGFGEEGKTMALASYGKPQYYDLMRNKLICIEDDGSFYFKTPFWGYKENLVFEEMFGKTRRAHEPLTQYHKDVAATVQCITEEIMLKLAVTLKRLTGSENLLITGGVGLNSVSNGKIAKSGLFKNVLAYPQANDAGIALGGALHVNYHLLGNERKDYWVMEGAYLGKEIDIENVESLAKEYDLEAKFFENIEEVTAQYIAESKIVAWVQGKEEIGPRALGNRSILGNPLNPLMKDLINERVKFRENWRPFAPSVLEEDAKEFFELEMSMPYMIVVSEVKEPWKDKLTAISHVDHTARVQTVNEKQNPKYYTLLTCVKEKIGIGMLINTSFNVKGEPLVQTSRQAIENFLRTDIDILVIGNYVFEKNPKSVNKEVLAFNPLHTNSAKLYHDTIKILGVYSVKNAELSDEMKKQLQRYEIKSFFIDLYDKRVLDNPHIDAILIILDKMPMGLNHLIDKSFVQVLFHLKDVRKKIYFEFDGEIMRYEDCSFLLDRYTESCLQLKSLFEEKPYLAVPKDMKVDVNLVEKIAGFIFADTATKEYFINANDPQLNLKEKSFLIDHELKTEKPFVINNKHVYKEYVIPKLIDLGVHNIYFYDEETKKISEDVFVYKDDSIHNNFIIKKAECPVCECKEFDFVHKVFSKPDDVNFFSMMNANYVMCTQCGTIIKEPLEIYQGEHISKYGEIYYNQMVNKHNEMELALHHHIINSQIPLYATLKEFLLNTFDPHEYKKWLDVGSAGVPTVFKVYDFTTIEPDRRTVEFGKKFLNSSKIVCNILENYDTNETYDGIVFHHSFYCLTTPNEAISKAKKLLNEKGVIVVAIGQFSMETSGVFEDNQFLRLEDILRGETLNIYYNPYSLKYIFQKQGFVCIDDVILEHRYHPHNTMYSSRYFVFKQATITKDDSLIAMSKHYHINKLENLFDLWEKETIQTLEKLNTGDTVFVGDFSLFQALQTLVKMDKIKGFINIDEKPNNKFTLDGTVCLSYEEFLSLEHKTIVVCSFMRQEHILKEIKPLGCNNKLLKPVRSSAIETLFFGFNQKRFLTKAFMLREHKFDSACQEKKHS